MAVAVELNYPGGTIEQYDEVIKTIGATSGGRHPGAGALFHWVAKTDDGFRVVDVWATKEQSSTASRKDQMGPIGQELGMVEPEMPLRRRPQLPRRQLG